MKDLLYTLAVIAAGILPLTQIYPTTLKVTEVNYQFDTLTLVTSTGFTYEMNGAEDYAEGDLVSAVMFNCFTPKDIADDKVFMARYSGF